LGQFENVITPGNTIAKNDYDFKPAAISEISLDMVLDKLHLKNFI
jgi:hypothetical protein